MLVHRSERKKDKKFLDSQLKYVEPKEEFSTQ